MVHYNSLEKSFQHLKKIENPKKHCFGKCCFYGPPRQGDGRFYINRAYFISFGCHTGWKAKKILKKDHKGVFLMFF